MFFNLKGLKDRKFNLTCQTFLVRLFFSSIWVILNHEATACKGDKETNKITESMASGIPLQSLPFHKDLRFQDVVRKHLLLEHQVFTNCN